MAKHKAPTQVSIVTEEKSKFAETVERWTVPFFIGAAVVTAVILWKANSAEQAKESTGKEWLAIRDATRAGDMDLAEEALKAAKGSQIEAYVQLTHSQLAMDQNRKDLATASVAALAAGDHPVLNGMEFPIGKGGRLISLADRAAERFAREKAWDEQNPVLVNDPPPEGSARVVLETTAGTIELALYEEKAPLRCANLIALVEDGFYDGLCFSRVVENRQFWTIQTGDPESSNTEDTSGWGRENGPDEKAELPREKNGLVHDAGYVSMDLLPASQDSSGSQFVITLRPAFVFDAGQDVFAKVVSGMDVAKTIGEGEIRPSDEGAQLLFAPVDPVVITKATVVR